MSPASMYHMIDGSHAGQKREVSTLLSDSLEIVRLLRLTALARVLQID